MHFEGGPGNNYSLLIIVNFTTALNGGLSLDSKRDCHSFIRLKRHSSPQLPSLIILNSSSTSIEYRERKSKLCSLRIKLYISPSGLTDSTNFSLI